MQIMDFLEHPIDKAIYLILNMPWWVYLIFLYCIFAGWKALYPRVISYYRLFMIPMFFGILSIPIIFVRYSLSLSHLSTWIISCLIGSFTGWWLYRKIPLQADKKKRLMKVPGSKSTLISILLILFFRYCFSYIHIVNPASLKNPFLIYPDLIISAIISGFILGRGIYFSFAYRKSPHTDLSK